MKILLRLPRLIVGVMMMMKIIMIMMMTMMITVMMMITMIIIMTMELDDHHLIVVAQVGCEDKPGEENGRPGKNCPGGSVRHLMFIMVLIMITMIIMVTIILITKTSSLFSSFLLLGPLIGPLKAEIYLGKIDQTGSKSMQKFTTRWRCGELLEKTQIYFCRS